MIVIVEPDGRLRQQLAVKVGDATSTATVASLEGAEETLQRGPASFQLVVLGPGLALAPVLAFAAGTGRTDAVGTLLVARELDPVAVRQAMRAGIDDVLTVEAPQSEWDEAVTRVRTRITGARNDGTGGPPGRDEGYGRLVTVFSTKGGCGKSLVASNLAVLAAEHTKKQVTLVDLDLQSGDLSIMLQLMPALSIHDAALSATRLDADALEGHLAQHRSGVSLLAAPTEPSLADQVSPEAVTRILGLLRATRQLTIVDGPAQFTDQILAAIDLSDLVVLVGSMDVPSIKNLRLAMTTLAQLGHPRDRLRIVLNRADSKVGLRAAEVEKSLGAKIDVMIPSSRDAPLSVNQGSPLAVSRPRSSVVTALRQLLPSVAPMGPVPEGIGRRRR